MAREFPSGYAKIKAKLEEVEKAHARGAPDSELVRELVQHIPRDVLVALYKQSVLENRSDLGAAIEAAFIRPEAHTPAGVQTTKSNTKPVVLEPDAVQKARDEAPEHMKRYRESTERERREKVAKAKKNMSNVERDIRGLPRER